MFRFAIEKPIVVTVGILILALFGLVAIFQVPVQMIPDLDVRVLRITTSWAGAAPQDVEKEIIIEQEEYLRRVTGVSRMISTASTGQGIIELEFPFGTDVNEVLIRVNNALSQVPEYPENVDEPHITATSFSQNSFMYFRTTPLPDNPLNVDMAFQRDFLEDHVVPAMERVPGVSEARMWSGSSKQVRIYVDPAKLAERGITLNQLREAIRSRNQDLSGGDVDSGKRRYLIRTIGRFDSVDALMDLIIARRDGTSVRLREVGYAELSKFEPRSTAYANGKPNITIAVQREPGSNVIEVAQGVEDAVAGINQQLLGPRGMQMTLFAEDVTYVKQAVDVVIRNLVIGALLATGVLYIFLRSTSATLIGAMGIPICTIAAFLGLLVTYRTINVISLAGVAFAIGMTLDNSIVVLENIHRHLNEGRSRLDAALTGVSEVWPAVLASTLTTVFVFLPVVFVQQEAGQLYSDIAVAISASILVSMLIATLVVPAACGRFLVRTESAQAGHGRGAALSRRYIGFARGMLGGTPLRLGVIALTVGLAALIITTLVPDAEYLPEGEEKKIFARLIPPPGYNIGEMDKLIRNLQDEFIPYVDADADAYDRGEIEIPPIMAVTAYASPAFAMLIMETHELRHINDLLQITSEKVSGFPGLISFATRGSIFSSNFGGSRSINIDISAPDLQTLFETGLKIFIRSREVLEDPQIRPEPASLTMGQPLLEVYPDWERAAELGFNTGDLGYLIWAFSDGAFVDEYYQGDEKIDMFLYSTQSRNADPTNLENLLVYSPNGGVVPLGAITNVRETVNTETIRRIDGVRTITLSVIPPRDVPLERGLQIVREEILDKMRAAGEVDPSVTLRISGAGDQLDATRSALLGNFVLAIFIAYLLLVAIFSHWGYPLIILTTVPIGISGGIVGLAILNIIGGNLDLIGLAPIQQPFDMITMLGFLVLIGTVVNNPILIVDKTLRNVRDSGMSNIEAVVDAARTRLRPILMSSVTTVVGLSPLVFNPGSGTELYRGLGAIVLFGLLFSTVVTLTFLPALLMQVLETLDRMGWRVAAPAAGD